MGFQENLSNIIINSCCYNNCGKICLWAGIYGKSSGAGVNVLRIILFTVFFSYTRAENEGTLNFNKAFLPLLFVILAGAGVWKK